LPNNFAHISVSFIILTTVRELISLWIMEHSVLYAAWINCATIWKIPGDLNLFSFSIVISTSPA
jgi:hypothetical protein